MDQLDMFISIPGPPIAQVRHRVAKNRMYDPLSEKKKALKLVVFSHMQEKNLAILEEVPLLIRFDFYTPIPKSWSKKKQKAADNLPDTSAPDIDNYIKFYMDLLNQLVYKDDRCVTSVRANKTRSHDPKTEIFIFTNRKED